MRAKETFFRRLLPLLPLLLLLPLPAVVQAQFTFTTHNGTITIIKYTGPGGAVTIPSMTNGLPVTSIGGQAFYKCTNLSSVTIPESVTSIGSGAFGFSTGLTAITVDPQNTFISSLLKLPHFANELWLGAWRNWQTRRT